MGQQILTPQELAALEARVKSTLPEGELMRRAGLVLAGAVSSRVSPGHHVVFLCGPGNNGGDGFAAAAVLRGKGYRVTCVLVGCEKPKARDASLFFEAWQSAGGVTISDPYMADAPDAAVDCLFGSGLNRPLSGDYQDAAQWFNERQALRIACDIPSGIDAMTGRRVGGGLACRAHLTVSMLAPKAGCFMNEGCDASGQVMVDELDVSVPLKLISLAGPEDFPHVLQPRLRNSHKGTFGHVAVVGGDTGHVGAALLAARAAIRLGAGLVTVEAMSGQAPAVDISCPELMFASAPVDLEKTACNVVGCGMGFSAKARKRLDEAIASPVPLILDADALRMVAADITLQEDLLKRNAHTVITPHPGEAAAILRITNAEVNANRIQAARELSLQTGAISVLKGCGTVVSLKSSRTWINPTGSAMLSTAGSGDVLAGMLGAMFAQDFGMVESTLSAVWLHGEAVSGRYAGVTAGDIAPAAAMVLEKLRAASCRIPR